MSDLNAYYGRADQQIQERDEYQAGPDPNTPPPVATDAMFYGIVGEVGRAAAQDTEVNPVAAAAAFLSYLSAQVGRDTYLPVGNTFHHARLFPCHVGRSGRGRKTDAVSLIHRIRSRIEEAHCTLPGQYHGGGLSTREGLALIIHDGYSQGKTEVPPIDDKRLWIVENEFANVLHQSKRDGNTLSAALRDAWDGMSIKPAIKSARIWATDPHIALHASVTPGELRELMSTRELSNGFANRFLMLWAERSKVEPFPRPASRETVHDLADRTAKVITFALGSYPTTKDNRRMELSDAARNAWDKAYRALIEPEATDTLTGLLERSAPYALRLAMLFALTDQSLTVELKHLKAGLAWVKYSRQSVRYIFTSAAELADSEVGRENADKILEFLGKHPNGASRTTINNDCFDKRASAGRIDDAIKLLLSESPPKITVELVPRSDGKPGKPTKLYRLFSNSEPGISGISSITEPARPATIRTVSGVSGIRSNGSDDQDLSPAKSANSENAETRANRLIEQSPQIPGTGNEKTGTMSAKKFMEGDRL